MIFTRLAAPGQAAQVTGLVLGAALLRALLLPLGDLLSTAVFAACLLAVCWSEPRLRPARGGTLAAIVVGAAVGVALVAPVAGGPPGARPLAGFWSWALVAALVATLEEASIRGVLYRRWEAQAGTLVAIVVGAAVFSLIHLPRYGAAALPLDAAVGLALGGLRALTGRVLACAVAHTVADWGAWFWA